MKVNILCVGDVVGRPGRHILSQRLSGVVRDNNIDCVVVNAENAAGGSGLTTQIYDKLLKYGADLITLGDHTYRKKEIIPILESANNIVRPANLSPQAAGKDFALYQTHKGAVVGVVALIGRMFMKPADCPYAKIDDILGRLQRQADIIVVDMHAEATSEKVAMGYYLDGKVSCVFGSHTHITTADEKILPKGTAYITDVGMTGAHDSVLGRKVESVIKAFRTQMPYPFEIATGDVRMSAVLVTIDSTTRCAESIQRIQITETVAQPVSYDSDDGHREYYNNGF
ncbi:MAG TPA: TIGR00282 family metallophosphoesterase [Planctomycetes bacterium]|nr:TIGR00282 family metallophosphoesterase [Planctomycetota bacterium]HIJ69994.1 TIGR00282 family metallophosphoesterase [Planctomycetota bacterium]